VLGLILFDASVRQGELKVVEAPEPEAAPAVPEPGPALAAPAAPEPAQPAAGLFKRLLSTLTGRS
jgi:hypothetical protein